MVKQNRNGDRETNYWKVAQQPKLDDVCRFGYTNLFKSLDLEEIDLEDTVNILTQDGGNHTGIIRFMVGSLDPNLVDTIFDFACTHGYLNTAKLTIGPFNEELLKDTIENGWIETAKLLIHLPDADLSNSDLIAYAAGQPTPKFLQELLNTMGPEQFRMDVEEVEEGILESAFDKGYLPNIRLLMKYGVNLSNGLATVAQTGNLRVLQFMIKRGSDLNLIEPLREAIRYKWPKNIQYLFDQGARVEDSLLLATDTRPSPFRNDVQLFSVDNNKYEDRARILPTVELVVKLFPPTLAQIREALPQIVQGDLPDVLMMFREYIHPDDTSLITLASQNSPESLKVLLQLGVRGDITEAIWKAIRPGSRILDILLRSGLPFRMDGLLDRITQMDKRANSRVRDIQKSINTPNPISQVIQTFTDAGYRFPDPDLEKALEKLWDSIYNKDLLRKQLYRDGYDPNRDIQILTDDPGLRYLLGNAYQLIPQIPIDDLKFTLYLSGGENVVARVFDYLIWQAFTLKTGEYNIYSVCAKFSHLPLFKSIVPPFPYSKDPGPVLAQFSTLGMHPCGNSFRLAFLDYLQAVPDNRRNEVSQKIFTHFQSLPGNQPLEFFDLYNFLLTLK